MQLVSEKNVPYERLFFYYFLFANRYRQILEKAIQLSGTEQLEALKAFVEASKCI